jgi:hypothetical protein
VYVGQTTSIVSSMSFDFYANLGGSR